MTDFHLDMLRAAARQRARQLRAHDEDPGDDVAAAGARRRSLQGLTDRARQQLARAARRRPQS